MKIYLVRHGESELNKKLCHQDNNVSLSPTGKRQAKMLAHRISQIPIDIIYSSTLKRAKETTLIINTTLNKKVVYTKLLAEKKNPSNIIGKPYSDKEAIIINQDILNRSEDCYWHYSDEENYTEFRRRIWEFVNTIDTIKVDHILVVTHGGPIKMMALFTVFGKNITSSVYSDFGRSFRPTNTGVTIMEKISEKSNWIVRSFNDITHLTP